MSFVMADFYKRFVDEELDSEGRLKSFKLDLPENFNFSYDVIDELAKNVPDKVAMQWVNEEGEEHIFTYKDLSEKSSQVANMMLAHGVKKGDFVMAVLKRHYEFWFLAYGLMKIGAILVPATCQLKKKDYVYRFDAASISYIVATAEDDVPNQVDRALEQYSGMKEKFITHGAKEGWIDFLSEMDKYPKTFERIETHVTESMLMYFSSGTTGYPKMVLHKYSLAAAHIITAKHWHHLDENSLHLTVSETGWAKCAWGKMFGQFICGATTFVYDFDRFIPANVLKVIQDYKLTSFCAPPTMLRMMIKEDLSKYDFSSVKRATTAGEALNPEVYHQFLKLTGLHLMEGFGQTETTLSVANLIGQPHKLGSMGKPTPLYDIHLLDSEGKEVGVGENGEICIKTGDEHICGLFDGYYGDEEKTREVLHDGFYHTGDVAWRDEDGFLWYVSRVDDVIKSSGYRIGPFEIESVIMELPYVLECGVSAAPDPVRGQVVKASIVLTKGTEGTEDLKKEIQNYVKHKTAPYKYPRIVVFKDELPKTISGKIQRNKL